MSSGGKIYKAITDAMAEISPIAKAKKNEQQRFYYRGIDDVMNELHPILAKHKIFFRMDIMGEKREDRQTKNGSNLIYSIITAKCYFATDDGSEVYTTVIGEGMDSGDKASNKAMAVAMKYACLQMFCIPTEDMSDPDSETPPASTPKNRQGDGKPSQGQRQPAQPQSKLSPEDTAGKNALGHQIKDIFAAKDPDGLPFFTEDETQAAREIFGSGDLANARKQCNALLVELARRKKEWKPVPHGEEEFKNDIPEGMYKEGEEPLF